MKTCSPAIQLLTLVWAECYKPPALSYRRLNAAMQDALRLAITSGMEFATDDFILMAHRFRADYWLDGERFYSLAVAVGNISACQSYESMKSRPPFMADHVDSLGDDFTHRKRGRLAVGCRFPWDGQYPEVTSFADDGTYLTACVYPPEARTVDRKVVRRYYKITRQMLQAARRTTKGKEGKA